MTTGSRPLEHARQLLEQARDELLAAGQEHAASLTQQVIREIVQPRDEGLKPEELNSANDD